MFIMDAFQSISLFIIQGGVKKSLFICNAIDVMNMDYKLRI